MDSTPTDIGVSRALGHFGVLKTANVLDRVYAALKRIGSRQPPPPKPNNLVPKQPGLPPNLNQLPPPIKATALTGLGIGTAYGGMRALDSGDPNNA